jgi:hypothetical protein
MEDSMKFMILMSEDPSWDLLSDAEQARIIADHEAFETDLRAAGSFVASGRFGPAPGMCVVQSADRTKRIVAAPDPGKGAIGGYYVIDVEDMARALEWASRCRFITGTNWVYPLWGA